MKRNILLLICSLLVFSCQSEVEDTFGESPELRISGKLKEYSTALQAPENGWKMEYAPTDEAGGFTVLLKFDSDQLVTLKADLNGYQGGKTSNYRVGTSQLPELVFETRTVFHELYEYNRSTFGAEFEFYIDEISRGKVVLKSKSDDYEEATIVTMVPALEEDWNTVNERVVYLDYLAGLPLFNTLTVSESTYSVSIDYTIRTMTLTRIVEGKTTTELYSVPFTVTPEGMKIIGSHTTGDGVSILEDGAQILKGREGSFVQKVADQANVELGTLTSSHQPPFGIASNALVGLESSVLAQIDQNLARGLSDAQSMAVLSQEGVGAYHTLAGGTGVFDQGVSSILNLPGYNFSLFRWNDLNLQEGAPPFSGIDIRLNTQPDPQQLLMVYLMDTRQLALSRIALRKVSPFGFTEENLVATSGFFNNLTGETDFKSYTVRYTGREEFSNALVFHFELVDGEESKNRILIETLLFL